MNKTEFKTKLHIGKVLDWNKQMAPHNKCSSPHNSDCCISSFAVNRSLIRLDRAKMKKLKANKLTKTLFLQGSIYDWVQYHRLHHRTFKTSDDPYYSEKDFLHAQVFAHIRSLSPKQEYLLKQVDMKDLEADKIVMFQKKYVVQLIEPFFSFSFLSMNVKRVLISFLFSLITQTHIQTGSTGFSIWFSLYYCQLMHR